MLGYGETNFFHRDGQSEICDYFYDEAQKLVHMNMSLSRSCLIKWDRVTATVVSALACTGVCSCASQYCILAMQCVL